MPFLTRVTRRAFLVSLNCIPLASAKSWDLPAFPNWSSEFIDDLITDSPWAKQFTGRVDLDRIRRLVEPHAATFNQIELPAGIGLPRGGSGSSGNGGGRPGVGWPRTGGGNRTPPSGRPDSTGRGGGTAEIFLTARWASALPVRRARALQQFGRSGLGTPEAIEMMDGTPKEYQLEIAGFPTTIVRGSTERFITELRNSARLAVPGRKPIPAFSAEMPEPGMHRIATLSFPRFEGLEAKGQSIELNASVDGMRIRERFEVSEMIYQGKLEL